MIEDILGELVDEGLIEEVLPDITFAYLRLNKDEIYHNPEQVIDWWYVVAEDEHREGICLNIQTDKRNYDITLSTEVLRKMFLTVANELTDTTLAMKLVEAEV